MALKRKRVSRRGRPRKRRAFRKTSFRKRAPRRRNSVMRVKRHVCIGTLSPAADMSTGTTYFWQYVQPSLDRVMAQFDGTGSALGSLTNKSEYQALFDQYRLGGLKFTFRPRVQDMNYDQNAAATPTQRVPFFAISMDPQSTLTPTGTYSLANLNLLLENGARIVRADRTFKVYLKPKVQEQYGAGATRYVSPKFTNLNDATGTDMKHRGFHLFLYREGMNSSAVGLAWDVFVTFYLTFKNPK